MMQIPCLPRLRYLLSCWGHRELQELPVSVNRDSGNVLLSFPLTWHLTVYCFVLDCCLAVSLSSCLSQMTSLFRWCRRIPSAFPSASSAQGPGWRQVLPPQVFGNHTCSGGSQAAGTWGRAHGQWRPQGLGWLPLAPFSPECGS